VAGRGRSNLRCDPRAPLRNVHALPRVAARSPKRVFRVLDHSAIYLLIAGTYTPFALGALRGPWGWSLFGTVWGLAILGIVAKSTVGFRFRRLSTFIYVTMGWMVIVAIRPLTMHVDRAGLAWLLAGGVAYTCGVYFYVRDDRVRYAHVVWHLFVAAGSACHFVAVLRYAAG
jgi:hemolysin III